MRPRRQQPSKKHHARSHIAAKGRPFYWCCPRHTRPPCRARIDLRARKDETDEGLSICGSGAVRCRDGKWQWQQAAAIVKHTEGRFSPSSPSLSSLTTTMVHKQPPVGATSARVQQHKQHKHNRHTRPATTAPASCFRGGRDDRSYTHHTTPKAGAANSHKPRGGGRGTSQKTIYEATTPPPAWGVGEGGERGGRDEGCRAKGGADPHPGKNTLCGCKPWEGRPAQ